jgi:hypothetical protein
LKIAVVDIDKCIVDPFKRFEAATEGGKIVWEKALSSELLHLDELMPQAVEHYAVIRSHYDQLILLTSRYDHMRQASLIWLSEHRITGYDRAIFKPWDKRFTKTKSWKAGQVLDILQEFSQPGLWQSSLQGEIRPITEVLILEDNEDNQQEISQTVAQWILLNKQARARYCLSMQDAVHAIQAARDYEET